MSSPLMSIGGLASGLDTASIIAQLVQIESIPLNQVAKSRQLVVDRQAAWTRIQTTVTGVADAARDLATASRLMTPVLKSSNDSAVTVSGTMTAGTSLRLSVLQLASSAQVAAKGYSSSSDVVGVGRVTTATGAAALGLANVRLDPAAAAGAHTLRVTQSSAAATLTGADLTTPVVIDATNNELTLTDTDGFTRTLTVAAGTYNDAAALAKAVGTALSGTGMTATVTGKGITLSSSDHGSAASLTAAGTFAAAVGLAGSSTNGKDAIVDADGAVTTLTRLRPEETVTVGSMALTLAGSGLSAGTSKVFAIDTTAGTTVADLASAVSASGTGLSAAVVTLGGASGGTEILMTSKAEGTAGAVAVDFAGFSAGTGIETVRAAQDAKVQVGSQTITRSSNTITDLVPGATLTLNKTTAAGDEVTISSAPNPDDLLSKVKKLVTQYNIAYDAITSASKSDPTGAKVGPLNSNSQLRSVLDQMRATFTSYSGTGSYTALAHIGVRLGRDGKFSVDEAAFKDALSKDEAAVTGLLARTGTATDSRVSFLSATETAPAGAQDVVVTRAAERASATGSVFAALGAEETLTVTAAGKTMTFTALAGMTAAEVASGLDKALKDAGTGLTAVLDGGAVSVRSTAYGSAAEFTIDSTGAGTGLGGLSAVGVDAEGTINGVAAKGVGQRLTSDKGVAVRVSVTSAEIAGAGGSLSLGTLTYNKGIAGGVVDLIGGFRNAGGVFTSAQDTAAKQLKMYDTRTEELQRHIEAYEARMKAQFTALESALSRLQSSTPNFSMLPSWSNK